MHKSRKHAEWWQKIPGLAEAIQLRQSITAVARELGLRPSSLVAWRRNGVPAGERCIQVHKITGVPLHKIRPDIYPNPSTKKLDTSWRVDV